MVTTKTRIYQFVGGPTFEAVFAQYETPAFNEVPGDIPSSELQFFTPFSYTGLPKTFAWLTGNHLFLKNKKLISCFQNIYKFRTWGVLWEFSFWFSKYW